MSIDFKAKPFYLNDKDIAWVNETLAHLTTEQKIGQLFCTLGANDDEDALNFLIKQIGIGGMMYRPSNAENVQKTHRYIQENATIPLLLAANLEAGGNGAAIEGTHFATPMGVAATDLDEYGYDLGKIACSEGAALGLNWAFAPIVDIDMNYRNPITNLRTFGSSAERVIRMAKGYMRAADEEGLAVSIKHFPGDGVDERDQHLVTSVNTLSCEAWDNSYGKIYKTLIDCGAKTVMVGHIAQPAYQKALAESTQEYENRTVPASQSKELMTKLLRQKLGFNGLIVTDASQMIGFTAYQNRKLAVPSAIAAGADMFLFAKDIREDYAFMMDGYKNGIFSRERLDDAVAHILALKASLKLPEKQSAGTLVPNADALDILRCDAHIARAKCCADHAVTLVKDTQNLLPLDVQKHKRVYLNVLEPDCETDSPLKTAWKQALSAEGFEVTVRNRDNHVDLMSVFSGTSNDPHALELLQEVFAKTTDFSDKYDLVLYVSNFETASNHVVIRLQWQGLMGMGNDAPWFVQEVPTLFVSMANPYHLIDVPMIKTFVNAYTATPETIAATVEKLMGRSTFKGVSPVDASCGRNDTLY
ncbi:MAG: glycoside hydrolase family 3 N-terminal domain-containing protein [Ruthenibacterium sp.]